MGERKRKGSGREGGVEERRERVSSVSRQSSLESSGPLPTSQYCGGVRDAISCSCTVHYQEMFTYTSS